MASRGDMERGLTTSGLSVESTERSGLLTGADKRGKLLFQEEDDIDDTDLVVSGRTAAEVSFTTAGKKSSFLRRWRGLIFVLGILVVAGIIGAIIYVVVDTTEDHESATFGPTIQPTSGPSPSCDNGQFIPPARRVDCLPDGNASSGADVCQSRGCCWDSALAANEVAGDTMGPPACYYPAYYGYRVGDIKTDPTVPRTFHMQLDNAAPGAAPFPGTVSKLRVTVQQETAYRLRITVRDDAHDRYEVPLPLYGSIPASPITALYKVTTNPRRWAFDISVRRTSSDVELFNTSLGPLIYSDQYLQLTNTLPSKYVYGLGEHVDDLLHSVNWTRLTLFSRDAFPSDTSRNLYGVQPMYLCVEPDGNTHGMLFRNSNAMDIILSPAPAITYRTIGGVLDFYMFLGPTPDQVVQQYTELVGRPFMPPYWSLGFHLCRWGYETSNHTMEVIERMREAKMPYDTQWIDIDYMRDHLDFTYDTVRFDGLPAMVTDLHAHDQHFVMIIDPGIANTTDNYPWYTNGLVQGVFIMDSSGQQPILGKVWPGVTAFPDFTNPNAAAYWTSALAAFYAEIPYDGVWIDMNEPSNFVPGSLTGCPKSSLNNPPYVPDVLDNLLYAKTLCMTAKQSASVHYNVHSLYGHTESVATMSAVRQIRKKRGFVLSRSTYTGSGNHTGHWLGDNDSAWPDMAESIPGILDFSIFGIPMVGADICGFRDNATEELCQRWMQLGSFYPFSRNHNIIGTEAQDPAAPRFSVAFQDSTRSALEWRYRMLPYLYTLFYQSAVSGASVARPLFFQYPSDANTLANHRQFMWGSDLLISPVLEEGATSVSAYFPAGRWYDIRTGQVVNSNGGSKTLDAPLEVIPLHQRAGSIIPTQQPAVTTTASRVNPFGVMVAIGTDGQATGLLYVDDGESLDWYSAKQYTLIRFNLVSNPNPTLTTIVTVRGYHDANDMLIRDFVFYHGGAITANMTATINNNPLPPGSVTYDPNLVHITVPTSDEYKQPISQEFTLALVSK